MKNILLLILAALPLVFILNGCSEATDYNGSLDSSLKADSVTARFLQDSISKADSNIAYSKLSGSEVLAQYRSMLNEYNTLLKQGKATEAKALKANLDALNAIASAKLVGDELKALTQLVKLSERIAAGEDVNLAKALKVTDIPSASFAAGVYVLQKTDDDPNHIQNKVVVKSIDTDKIQISSVYVGGEKEVYNFTEKKKDNGIVIEFGLISEDSGDFLSGGEIEISNGKCTLILYSGSEANYKSVYVKL
jgi:hypothetical protein